MPSLEHRGGGGGAVGGGVGGWDMSHLIRPKCFFFIENKIPLTHLSHTNKMLFLIFYERGL